MRDGNVEAGKNRRYERWFGVGTMSCGLAVLLGAWREVAHRDGLLLATVPASVMPVLAALLARRAARGNTQP